ELFQATSVERFHHWDAVVSQVPAPPRPAPVIGLLLAGLASGSQIKVAALTTCGRREAHAAGKIVRGSRPLIRRETNVRTCARRQNDGLFMSLGAVGGGAGAARP